MRNCVAMRKEAFQGRRGAAGIFQRHGLDVELVYIAAGSRAVQTLVGGSIDVAAISGPAGVDAKLAGADTVYIAIPVNRVIAISGTNSRRGILFR